MSAPGSAEIGALVALIHQERLSQAEAQARSMLSAHPKSGILWKILSVALVQQGKNATDALEKAVQLLPQDAEAHRNLGAALYDQGQWKPALASFGRALDLQPDDVASLVDAANTLRALGRAREAVPLYQRALSNDPNHTEAQNNLGNAFLDIGQPQDAVNAYRLALRQAPDDAQVCCNLGDSLRVVGQQEEALRVTHRALELDPQLSVAHNNLGMILMALGRRTEAEASLRQALALSPDFADALNNLSSLLREQGRRAEALPLLRRSLEVDPSRPESHFDYASLLFEMRRMDDAVAAFRRALELRPTFAQAHLGLGLVMRQQRRPADAEKNVQAALAIDPAYVEAIAFLGELRADSGRFADADALFQRALAIAPDFAPAYSSIATHRKMTDADTAWKESVEKLLANPLPLAHAVGLHYSLGKHCDDIGRYEAAFHHYRAANELKKGQSAPYEREKFTQRLNAIISSFNAAFVQQRRDHSSPSERPVLIIGMPRSGTSLAEQILASHPAVFGAGEVTFWNAAYNRYRDDELKRGQAVDLLPIFANEYLRTLATSSANAPRVVDKMPANFMYAGLLHAALPAARIIHMQRHPFDTCLSIYFQNFFNIGRYAHDLDDLAHYYGEYLRILRHWRAVLPAATMLEVPYEGLIEDQEGWIRRMLEFIGLPWDPRCLDFHQTDRAVITASKWQVRQKISKTSAGRWRHYEKFVAPLRRLLEGEQA